MIPRSPEFNVSDIADKLKFLKSSSATTAIFLGAKAGALFRSQRFYKELRGFDTENLYGFSLLERFSRSYGILTKKFNVGEIQNFLASGELLKEIRPEVPELCVAQLMKEGVFKYILSTGVHREFEQAFEQMKMELGESFSMYWPKKNKNIPSVAASRQVLFTFYKLFGDVHDDCTIKDRLDYMDGHKDLEKIAKDLSTVPMLIIGLDSVWDQGIISALFPRSGTTWYVNDVGPPEDSTLHEHLEKCNAERVVGFDGRYENFVRDLCWHMTGTVPANQELLGLLEGIKKVVDADHEILLKLREETETLRDELGKLRLNRTRRNKKEEK